MRFLNWKNSARVTKPSRKITRNLLDVIAKNHNANKNIVNVSGEICDAHPIVSAFNVLTFIRQMTPKKNQLFWLLSLRRKNFHSSQVTLIPKTTKVVNVKRVPVWRITVNVTKLAKNVGLFVNVFNAKIWLKDRHLDLYHPGKSPNKIYCTKSNTEFFPNFILTQLIKTPFKRVKFYLII